MPRARNIKPAFFKNEFLAELPFEARLLFVGLWCLADKSGRLEDRPKRIKMEIFPADNVNVDELLVHLEGEFIDRYSVNGIEIIQVINFEKHQNPHHKEKGSELPGKDPGQTLGKPQCGLGKTLLIPDSGSLKPEKAVSKQIEDVVGHYTTKKTNPRVGRAEREKIRERLQEGRTVADLKAAIDGCFSSKWHVDNQHLGLELICRSDAKLQDFIDKGLKRNGREKASESW